MKRLLLALIPWMAISAVGQDVPRSAQVAFTYLPPISTGVYRVGDACYVTPAVLKTLGWKCSISGFDATIEVDQRTVKSTVKVISNQITVPLLDALSQLGAASKWASGKREKLVVTGTIREVTAQDGTIQFSSSLPIKPKLILMDNPSRVVIDVLGANLDDKARLQLGPNCRTAQLDEDTVRIVVECEGHPTQAAIDVGRSLTLEWPATAKKELPPEDDGEGAMVDEQAQPALTSDPSVFPKAPPVLGQATIGKIQLISEGKRTTLLRLPISGSLPSPNLKRPRPDVLQLDFAGAHLSDGTSTFKSIGISGATLDEDTEGVHATFEMASPMGVEISSHADDVQILFVKPDVGDGKIAHKVIVVDAGHGGTDTGARSPDKSVNEKDLTLPMAMQLSQKLAAEGATVIMTRKTDVLIPLNERPAIANRNRADFFISIHINSNAVAKKMSGTISFYHGDDSISALLATCIGLEVAKVSGLPYKGAWSDFRIYRNKGFAVLRHSEMPAILLEVGFINHATDRAQMVKASFQDAVTTAIVKGVKVYLGNGN